VDGGEGEEDEGGRGGKGSDVTGGVFDGKGRKVDNNRWEGDFLEGVRV
jgi:hypothetical protein